MNEAETRADYIDTAIKATGWGVVDGSRIRRNLAQAERRLMQAIKTLAFLSDCSVAALSARIPATVLDSHTPKGYKGTDSQSWPSSSAARAEL